MSLIVVYATDTGHVLGALAPSGPVADAPAVSQLAGDALPLWVGGADGQPIALPVPANHLGSAVVNDEPGVLTVPLAFGVQPANGTPKPDLLPLNPVTEGGGPLIPPGGNVTVDVQADQVTVKLPSNTDKALAVLLVVSGPSGTQPVLIGSIDANSASKAFPMKLPSGNYGTLALVAGWRGVVDRGVVP